MPYQDSSYQDSSYQDSNYGGNGGGTPPPPDIPPFGPPLLWTSVLDDLNMFFDELGGPVIEHGNDQNSYYDDGERSAPLGALFLQDFGWMANIQNMPDAHYFDYLTNDVDPEFLLTAYGSNNFVANFSHGQVAVQKLSDGQTFAMTLNGITVFGTWHPGGPTTSTPEEVTVTGGHWTFQYTGFGADVYNGNPPPAPPPQLPAAAPSADAAAARADPGGVAEQHRQNLSSELHALLDSKGGHFLVPFHGPNGVEYFDLADLVNIIDHYHINPSDNKFLNVSGGAGAVHSDGHGGWVTDFNREQLIGYESMAYNQLDFIILHEVSHMLPNGLAYTQGQFDSWLAGGGTKETYIGTNGFNGSSALWHSESYANNMAAAIELQLGMTPPPHPPGDFNYAGFHG